MAPQVQNTGIARITQLLIGASWWLQWGAGSAAPKTANAVTPGTTTEGRVPATPTQQMTGGVANDTLRLTATITSAGTRTITEVGAFDAVGSGSPPAGGNMNIYGDFSGIALASGDSIAFTLDTKFT